MLTVIPGWAPVETRFPSRHLSLDSPCHSPLPCLFAQQYSTDDRIPPPPRFDDLQLLKTLSLAATAHWNAEMEACAIESGGRKNCHPTKTGYTTLNQGPNHMWASPPFPILHAPTPSTPNPTPYAIRTRWLALRECPGPFSRSDLETCRVSRPWALCRVGVDLVACDGGRWTGGVQMCATVSC
jgi:hypothetical protein